MKFPADMGISNKTVSLLQEKGHDAIHLRNEGLQRITDDQILEKTRNEGRILLTLDLDFGYLLAISGEKLPSVILFRLGNESSEVVNERLVETLDQCMDDLNTGCIVTVDESSIRVRKLPIHR